MITVVTSMSAVQAQLEQNPNHQPHMIPNTRVMRVLWKVVQALTTEVMGVASDVVGIAGVDFTVVGVKQLHQRSMLSCTSPTLQSVIYQKIKF